ncbi:MAG: hypothetical protein M3004_09940 [Bacteroidota bacterium]|nr:hypothetical protein [Bacteroidota bacterium]
MSLSCRICLLIIFLFIKNEGFSQPATSATVSASVVSEQIGIETSVDATLKDAGKNESIKINLNSLPEVCFSIVGSEFAYSITCSSSLLTINKKYDDKNSYIFHQSLNLPAEPVTITINYN